MQSLHSVPADDTIMPFHVSDNVGSIQLKACYQWSHIVVSDCHNGPWPMVNTKKCTLVSCAKLACLVPRTLPNFLVPHRKLCKGLYNACMNKIKEDTVYKMDSNNHFPMYQAYCQHFSPAVSTKVSCTCEHIKWWA